MSKDKADCPDPDVTIRSDIRKLYGTPDGTPTITPLYTSGPNTTYRVNYRHADHHTASIWLRYSQNTLKDSKAAFYRDGRRIPTP